MAAVEWTDLWTDAAHTLSVAGLDPLQVVPLAETLGADWRRPAWQARAACRGQFELFFDDTRTDEAASVCAGCPVTGECERWARRQRPEGGVWAGRRIPALPRTGAPACAACGGARRLVARGLCRRCYQRARRQQAG